MLETQEEANKNILNISDNLKYISEFTLNVEDKHKKIIPKKKISNKINNNKAKNKNKQKSSVKNVNDSYKEIVLKEDIIGYLKKII